MKEVLFIVLSILLVVIIILIRREDLKIFLFPTLILVNHDGVKKEAFWQKHPNIRSIIINIIKFFNNSVKNAALCGQKHPYICSIIIKIIIFFIAIKCVINNDQDDWVKQVLAIVIAIILIEWFLILLYKGACTLADICIGTHDGGILILLSVWVAVGCYWFSSKASWIPMVMFFVIVINIAISFKYMGSLLIKREAYLKQEIKNITPANQLFAIVVLIVTHIVNYSVLIFTLIRSNWDFSLIKGTDEVSKLKDVIYYVIITYTTVGYGDITPQGVWGLFVASMISFTSYFMSAAVIGIILNIAVSNPIQNDKAKSADNMAESDNNES